MLINNNIFIKSIKIFLDYLLTFLLYQKINSFELITSKKKLKTITKLYFSRIFRQLKTYLSLINWLRDYVSHYIDISKLFQNRKIKLLRNDSIVENARRIYFNKTRLQYFTKQKLVSFVVLQKVLTKSFYLIHSNTKKQLFVDFDVNKKFDFDIMLYYMKKVFREHDKYSSQHVIELIFFFELIYYQCRIKVLIYRIENNKNCLSIEKNALYSQSNFETIIIYIAWRENWYCKTNNVNDNFYR